MKFFEESPFPISIELDDVHYIMECVKCREKFSNIKPDLSRFIRWGNIWDVHLCDGKSTNLRFTVSYVFFIIKTPNYPDGVVCRWEGTRYRKNKDGSLFTRDELFKDFCTQLTSEITVDFLDKNLRYPEKCVLLSKYQRVQLHKSINSFEFD